MANSLELVEKKIIDNFRELTQTKAFTDWFDSQSINTGDLIVVNNSFIYRSPLVKTVKNNQFIGMSITKDKIDLSSISIITPNDFNLDFKIISSKDKTFPTQEPLSRAVSREVHKLGQLVFFLLGDLIEVPICVEIQSNIIHELIYDPQAKKQEIIQKDGKTVFIVNQLSDPELAWNCEKQNIENLLTNNIEIFEKEYAKAFKKLQEDARFKMILPDLSTPKTENSFINKLHDSIVQQISSYKNSLGFCTSENDENNKNIIDIMRIAYNFSGDAIKLIQLLVSLADLKPILLWLTIKEHYDLAEAFRNLPWTKSFEKPSMARYTEIVSGARNRAFHNLLIFDRTIEASLDGIQINAKKLTLLPPFGKQKTTIALDYEDREMIEILKDLTRAPETYVSLDFWSKNLIVMEAFEKLLGKTEDMLWLLNDCRK